MVGELGQSGWVLELGQRNHGGYWSALGQRIMVGIE